jgi:hypothetical protein
MYILEKGLSYQRLILVVQEKLDCPVSEIRLSDFHGFKPPRQNLPLHCFSHFSLPYKNNREGDPKTPIGWFLHGILLGEINSPRTSVFVSPASFPHLKVFSPNPRSLYPMDGFDISLVHCLHSSHRTIPYNISKFPWLNRSDS